MNVDDGGENNSIISNLNRIIRSLCSLDIRRSFNYLAAFDVGLAYACHEADGDVGVGVAGEVDGLSWTMGSVTRLRSTRRTRCTTVAWRCGRLGTMKTARGGFHSGTAPDLTESFYNWVCDGSNEPSKVSIIIHRFMQCPSITRLLPHVFSISLHSDQYTYSNRHGTDRSRGRDDHKRIQITELVFCLPYIYRTKLLCWYQGQSNGAAGEHDAMSVSVGDGKPQR
jgi:hypothetical protein